MIATAERPLGTVATPPTSSSERRVVRGGGTSLGSLGFTTTWVEGAGCGCVWVVTVVVAGGGAGCCCSVVTVVVVCAAAGRATNASASARVFDMVVSRKWSPGNGLPARASRQPTASEAPASPACGVRAPWRLPCRLLATRLQLAQPLAGRRSRILDAVAHEHPHGAALQLQGLFT